ncbi:uncharacterized protein LOC117175222 [Belonocnema kinseyi]|uniref:uncharacterized protein LOC117175222 n=1 Tax=Belonocnema kinseyi TaxID=2817044 RepID=UPI00143CE3BD|nr:uncharacterized protein LOC117175222 [Belonocnema kinseyi]XP_033220772.1 uncharacterized protein LOC117175222 [Belonocnema kinseyi]
MIDMKLRVTILWLISLVSGRIINPFPSQTLYSAHSRNELELITDGDNENSFQSSDWNAIRNSQLSKADWSWYNIMEPNGSVTYAFGYDNAIDPDGNEHYRTEERLRTELFWVNMDTRITRIIEF